MTDVRVDTASLRKVASLVQSKAGSVSNAVPVHDQAAVQPVGDGDGWLAWGAMAQVGRAWLTEIGALSDELRDSGNAIVRAAGLYDDTDQGSAANLRRAGPQASP